VPHGGICSLDVHMNEATVSATVGEGRQLPEGVHDDGLSSIRHCKCLIYALQCACKLMVPSVLLYFTIY